MNESGQRDHYSWEGRRSGWLLVIGRWQGCALGSERSLGSSSGSAAYCTCGRFFFVNTQNGNNNSYLKVWDFEWGNVHEALYLRSPLMLVFSPFHLPENLTDASLEITFSFLTPVPFLIGLPPPTNPPSNPKTEDLSHCLSSDLGLLKLGF